MAFSPQSLSCYSLYFSLPATLLNRDPVIAVGYLLSCFSVALGEAAVEVTDAKDAWLHGCGGCRVIDGVAGDAGGCLMRIEGGELAEELVAGLNRFI